MIITLESCQNLSDNELVLKSLENLDYFSCIYQRYEYLMLRYIHRISGAGPDEARDILQESFIKIWRNLNEFDHSMKLSSWIYRIVHNETVSAERKKKSYGKDNTLNFELFRNILADDPDLHHEQEARHIEAMEAMNKLPVKYKEILILKFLENKSYEEISDILKIPEGTIAIRISRAKVKIREILNSLLHHK